MMPWILSGYMWLFVHRPFEIWPFLGTMRIERVYMIFAIIAWLVSSSKKRQLGNIFTTAIFSFTAAITAATLFSPYTNVLGNDDYQNWLKYLVFYVLVMTSIKTEKDLKFIVSGFIVACFLFIGHSYREYLGGRIDFAAGVSRLIGVGVTFSEFNDYGTLIVCMLPMIFPMVTLCKRKWHYLFIIGYILLTLRSVQLTGSRTAFIMLVALLILPVLISRHRFKLIPVILILAPVGWMSMTEGMRNRYRTIWDSSVSDQANANMRGRTVGFYGGMENWARSPLFGVGPAQHGAALGGRFQAHNLPGQVAGETGTFGVVTWLFMLSCFGINHFNIWTNYKYLQEKKLEKEGLYCWRVSVGVMYAITMSLLQGIGLHNGYRFPWVWFGAFQALAATIMQEKVDDAVKGKLLPPLDDLTKRKK